MKNDFLKAFELVRNDIINNHQKDLLVNEILNIKNSKNELSKNEIEYLFLLDYNFIKEFYGITDKDEVLNKIERKEEFFLNRDLMNERIKELNFDYKFYNWCYKLNLNEDKAFHHFLNNNKNLVNFDNFSKSKGKLYLKCCDIFPNIDGYSTLEDCKYLREIINRFDLIITDKDINFFISKKTCKNQIKIILDKDNYSKHDLSNVDEIYMEEIDYIQVKDKFISDKLKIFNDFTRYKNIEIKTTYNLGFLNIIIKKIIV